MHIPQIHTHPIEGIPIIEPENTPLPGEVIIGYEVIHDHDKVFTTPDPKNMNKAGWASVILGLLCFWPVTCVPCFLSCSYSKCQRPVYGPKKQD
jgi:hypothetical protein